MMMKHSTFYSVSKAETIINESDFDDVFELIYSTIISNIKKCIGEGLSQIIDSAVDHTNNISKQAFKWQQFCQITKRIRPSRKRFIFLNISDDERFKLCLARYLHHADHYLAKIRKDDKIHFKDIKFPARDI